MNIYVNTLEEIAESGNLRMSITKIKVEFSKDPLEAILQANRVIWGPYSNHAKACCISALSTVNAPRYHEALRASIEAALWHKEGSVRDASAIALIRLDDASSLKALEALQRFHPESAAVKSAIKSLLMPL
jgi:HEAT repeat protein